MGTLYYGDNLDILGRYLDDESVDLVYLDPPFNSAQNYNAFFQEKDGTAAAAQIRAFEDTWEWNQESRALPPGKRLEAASTLLLLATKLHFVVQLPTKLSFALQERSEVQLSNESPRSDSGEHGLLARG